MRALVLLLACLATLQAAPPPPSGLEATGSPNRVTLTWDHVQGATTYRIFRGLDNNSDNAFSIAVTESLTYTETAANAIRFFYWVRAESPDGVSALSPPVEGAAFTRSVTSNATLPVPPITLVNPQGPPTSVTGAKIYLGKTLFWDEQLSSTQTVACGTCHRFNSGGVDPRSSKDNPTSQHPGRDGVFGTADDAAGSMGVPKTLANGSYQLDNIFGLRPQVTPRRAIAPMGSATATIGLMWDGKAGPTFNNPGSSTPIFFNGAALESQVFLALLNPAEMAHTGRNIDDVVNRISQSRPLALAPSVPAALSRWLGTRSYADLFNEAFGTPSITPARIAIAIATYERTLMDTQAVMDNIIGGAAGRGFLVFGNSGCTVCHSPFPTNDRPFLPTGVRPAAEDPARGAITGVTRDQGAFRSPSIRNVSLRPGMFHTGRGGSIEEVIEFYNRGGDFQDSPGFNPGLVRPLNLTAAQKSDLAAFLRYATVDPRVAGEIGPVFDRPLLYIESARVPVITGPGTPDAKGNMPEIVALEPPYAGNAHFTIAVGNIAPGSQATLAIDRVDPAISAKPGPPLIQVQATVSDDGAGHGFASATVPLASDLTGTLWARWFIVTNGQTSISPAARFTAFKPEPISETFTSLSAASLKKGPVARESIVSGFGSGLANLITTAPAGPLPTTLAGLRVSITDAAGLTANAQLFFVSPNQINYLVPASVAEGEATAQVFRDAAPIASGKLQIVARAPAFFAANSNGRDAAAAQAVRASGSVQTPLNTVQFDADLQLFIPTPLALGAPTDDLVVILYGTGIRGAGSVRALIADTPADVLYAGPQSQFAGLDQVNLRVPRSLAGRGEVEVILWVDGVRTNPIRISVQ